MRIAQVAPLDYIIPPRNYGGVERVVGHLTDALVRLGHDVTLFALSGSQSLAHLVPINLPELADRTSMTARLDTYMHNDLLGSVYAQRSQFDVIHSHLEYMTFPMAKATAHPTVVTQHGRLDTPDLRDMYAVGIAPQLRLTCVSSAQWKPMEELKLTRPHVIPNPVAVDQYRTVHVKENYAAFLGRISPEKGVHKAVEIAQRAGLPLKAAGVIHPGDMEYWEQVVQPKFRDAKVEWLGPVADHEKQELLGHAQATLFPSDWPEAFGLVQLESMACGTPVISLDRGATREIVQHGRSGYICSNHDEMITALTRAHELDPDTCRSDAEAFAPEVVAEMYIEVYLEAVNA